MTVEEAKQLCIGEKFLADRKEWQIVDISMPEDERDVCFSGYCADNDSYDVFMSHEISSVT